MEGKLNAGDAHLAVNYQKVITVRYMTKYSAIVENAIDKASERDVSDILHSCIGRGKTIKEGDAVYDFISGLQVGIADMTDSIAAIKKLVFKEKKITPAQLWDAILDNFTSLENQRIQDMLINDALKYGNDNDYVDELELGRQRLRRRYLFVVKK